MFTSEEYMLLLHGTLPLEALAPEDFTMEELAKCLYDFEAGTPYADW